MDFSSGSTLGLGSLGYSYRSLTTNLPKSLVSLGEEGVAVRVLVPSPLLTWVKMVASVQVSRSEENWALMMAASASRLRSTLIENESLVKSAVGPFATR